MARQKESKNLKRMHFHNIKDLNALPAPAVNAENKVFTG